MSNIVIGPRDPMPQWYVDDMRDGAQLGDDITVETVYKTTDNLLVRKVVSGKVIGIYPYIVCTTSGTWRWIDAAMYRWRHRRQADGQERSRDAGGEAPDADNVHT